MSNIFLDNVLDSERRDKCIDFQLFVHILFNCFVSGDTFSFFLVKKKILSSTLREVSVNQLVFVCTLVYIVISIYRFLVPSCNFMNNNTKVHAVAVFLVMSNMYCLHRIFLRNVQQGHRHSYFVVLENVSLRRLNKIILILCRNALLVISHIRVVLAGWCAEINVGQAC